jgi:hypothetical protein
MICKGGHKTCVATLVLGSRPRQKGYKVASQEEVRESRQEEARESKQEKTRDKKKPMSHITYSREC